MPLLRKPKFLAIPGLIAALFLVAGAKGLPAAAYTWANVQIGAGGFVAGIEPSLAQSGLFYARTDVGGAYRWSDATQTWTPLTDMFPSANGNYLGIESLAPDPTNADNVYAAGGMYLTGNGNGVILSSTNQGASWTVNPIAVAMGGNAQGRGMGERLAVDPMLPSTLYYGSRENGLWKSTNSAATWAQITAFPTDGETFTGQYGGTTPGGLSSVVIDGLGSTSGTASSIVFVAAASTAAGSNLYESVNGGAAWTEVTITAGGPTGLMVHHAALGSDGNLWLAYSNDIGPNEYTAVSWVGQIWKLDVATWVWTNVTPPTTEWPAAGSGMAGGLSVDPENPQHVVVSTLDWYSGPDRVLATTDGGTVWTVIGQPISYSGATVPTYNINGVNWWYPGTTPPAIGTGPTNWVEALAIDPFNGDRVFHGCGGGTWQSLDTQDAAAGGNGGGVTWNFYDVGLEETVPLYMMPSVNGAFLGTVGDIGGMRNSVLTAYSSSGEYSNPVDNNNNWIDFAEGNTNFVVRVGNSNTASPYNEDVAYSTNNGVSWTPCSAALPGYTGGNEMGSVAVNASGTVIVAAPYSGYGSPAYSTNDGTSWTTCTGLPSGALVAADRVTATLFYATSGGTLYVSTNSGQSFSSAGTFTTGGGSGAPRPVFKETGEVWVATGGSLYRFTGLGGTVTTTNISSTYNLSDVTGVGFGISLTPTAHPAVYMIGDSAGVYGFYRNDDGLGDTWTQMNDSQHQYGWLQGNYIGGDESVYGRCYLTTGGRGYIYGSIDLTPTPTASVTLTDTLSATRSPTPSATPTQTYSVTLSDTPSATKSVSPSVTPSLTSSATDSPTLSVTLSVTLSATPSVTPSPTLSASSSATRSATPSPTASISGTSTESSTPTATPSGTATFSPSASASPSVSETQTFTTASATPSPTASASPSASETQTATTASVTASPTASGSPTASASPSASPTTTPSLTDTGTPSGTASASATATASATPSPTDSPTDSPTGSPTASPSVSPSLSPSPSASSSVTAGASPTRTFTASSAATGTATPTAAAAGSRTQGPGGPLRILSQVPVPNPNPKSLALLLDGSADGVEVRVWTEAFVLVAEGWSGPVDAGWNRVPFPAGFPGSVPPGLYYVTVQATRGASVSPPIAPARVLELR
jgi:hypothetical protein